MKSIVFQSSFNIKNIPIENIISLTGTQLIKRGNKLIGICPLHNDKGPSLVVYSNSQSWCCFGNCQSKNGRYNGGDSVEFIKQRFNYSYFEAVKWIEDNFGGFQAISQVKKEVKEQPKLIDNSQIIYWHRLLDYENKRDYFYSRGFEDDIVNKEQWGWTGQRYTIPIWEDEPGNSKCLAVKGRLPDDKEGLRYKSLITPNGALLWGLYHCQSNDTILIFAGEFDAAKAVQDGFPACSLVDGVNSFSKLPENWPNMLFPTTKNMIVVFDKREENVAGRLASIWNENKGIMTSKVFIWPFRFNVKIAGKVFFMKDYCQFRQHFAKENFIEELKKQKLWI